MQNTKNQHYVWRHYLAAWAAEDSFCCYRHRDEKVFETQPSVIANERYFYEIFQLSSGDKTFLEMFISKASSEELRKLNRDFVSMTQIPFKLRDALKGKLRPEVHNQLEQELRWAERNLTEKYYGSIETLGQPLLDSLRNRDDGFYTDEKRCLDFLYFLMVQYFRTAKMKYAQSDIYSHIPDHDPKRTAGILNHLAATNVASGLFLERRAYQITFLTNNAAQTPFITGDQPVLNMRDPNTTDDLELFYPLSPSLALLLAKPQEKDARKERTVSPYEVEFYNYEIYRRSEDQTYSNSENYLRELVKMPKGGVV